MFLNENFKREYAAFLEKQEAETFINTYKELMEAQKEITELFETLIIMNKDDVDFDTLTESVKNNIFEMLLEADPIPEYKPVTASVEVTKMKQMRFPQNIIHFIKVLTAWINNVVQRFLQRFINGARGVFGMPFQEKIKKMKFDLDKVSNGLSMIPNKEDAAKVGPNRIVKVNASDVEVLKALNLNLSESVLNEKTEGGEEDKPKDEKSKGREISLVQIDITKDMMDLTALIQHFLEAYDLAYGSNRENLFATDDIELLLRLFKETISDIQNGTLPNKAIAGKLVHDTVLDPRRLRENLYRTKNNVDQLTNIYGQIKERITKTLAKIGQKQVLASTTMGGGLKLFTSGTYQQMIRILNILEPRVVKMAETEKQLEKAKHVFDQLVVELGKQRQTMTGFGTVAFIDPYQKKIEDLFMAARDVSQTIGLRLGALSLYAKNLQEIYEAIETIANVNSVATKYI